MPFNNTEGARELGDPSITVTIISQREESEAPGPLSTPNPRTNKQQQMYG